jgi:hypothetical protein
MGELLERLAAGAESSAVDPTESATAFEGGIPRSERFESEAGKAAP